MAWCAMRCCWAGAGVGCPIAEAAGAGAAGNGAGAAGAAMMEVGTAYTLPLTTASPRVDPPRAPSEDWQVEVK